MGLHRIQLAVAPFNPAGIRAYEKAGFVEEGRRAVGTSGQAMDVDTKSDLAGGEREVEFRRECALEAQQPALDL
jgi:hypothetical protein